MHRQVNCRQTRVQTALAIERHPFVHELLERTPQRDPRQHDQTFIEHLRHAREQRVERAARAHAQREDAEAPEQREPPDAHLVAQPPARGTREALVEVLQRGLQVGRELETFVRIHLQIPGLQRQTLAELLLDEIGRGAVQVAIPEWRGIERVEHLRKIAHMDPHRGSGGAPWPMMMSMPHSLSCSGGTCGRVAAKATVQILLMLTRG